MHLTPIVLFSLVSLGFAKDLFVSTNSPNRPKVGIRLDSYCPSHGADEESQRQIFARFVQTLYGEKNVSKAFSTYVDSGLIEHDPFEQSRDEVVARLSHIIPVTPFTVLRSIFNGDTGFVHVRLDEENAPPVALADIYRMDGTCIVEHWDVVQSLPENSTNPKAMF
jgi:predicted SnoaL-like aldol condensation-catalyzing enzyme